MKNRYLIFLFILFLIHTSLLAQEETQAKEESNETQQQTKTTKASSSEKVLVDKKLLEKINYMAQDLEEVIDRLDDVERTTLMDKLKLKLDFRTTINNYIYRENTKALRINGKEYYDRETMKQNYGLLREDGESLFITNLRLRLKLRANIHKRLRFTGWITTYKGFNSASSKQFQNTPDVYWGYYPDGRVHFERAYVDFFPLDWFAITVGRTPTTNGYPNNIRNNTVRLGTFDELTFNMPFDSLFFTFLLDDWGIPKGYFRLMLINLAMVDNLGEIENQYANNLITTDLTEDSIYLGFLYEMQVPKIRDSIFSLNALWMPKFAIPMITRENKDTLALSGSMNETLVISTLLGFQNFLQTGFSFFANCAISIITPPDRKESDDGIVFLKEGDNKRPLLAFGGRVDGKSLFGYLLFFGAQYALPARLYDGHIKIGVDYNYGSKKYFNQYMPDTTGFNRFGTRGHFLDSYLMFPVYYKSNLKIGYIYNHHLYEQGFPYGQITPHPDKLLNKKVDEVIHNIYMMYNIEF